MSGKVSMTTYSVQDSQRLGQCLGKVAMPGDVYLLSGPLGAGKTQFAKGFAKGIGVSAEVTSPTFNLVSEYEGRIPWVHMDLYRLYEEEPDMVSTENLFLSDAALESIGFHDYLDGRAVVLMEWAQGVAELFSDALDIRIEMPPLPRIEERIFHIQARGLRSLERLDAWVKQWLF